MSLVSILERFESKSILILFYIGWQQNHRSECMAWQAATDTWAIGREDFQVVTILHREAHFITNMVIFISRSS